MKPLCFTSTLNNTYLFHVFVPKEEDQTRNSMNTIFKTIQYAQLIWSTQMTVHTNQLY